MTDAITFLGEINFQAARSASSEIEIDVERFFVNYRIDPRFNLQGGLYFTPIGVNNRFLYASAWLMNSIRVPDFFEEELNLFPTHSVGVGVNGAATLKFDVHNESLRNLASMVLSISLAEAPREGSGNAVPTVLVGPVKVLAKRLVLPGYTVHYELRLRNISSDCGCVPTVDVLEAHFAPEDEPEH